MQRITYSGDLIKIWENLGKFFLLKQYALSENYANNSQIELMNMNISCSFFLSSVGTSWT